MNRGKQSVRKGVWYIGGRKKRTKKQNGKGFPLGLLASVGIQILSEIAKPVFKKILGRGKRRRKRLRWNKQLYWEKRDNPKIINLPNGKSFTSRWERISRKQLPINIKVKRNRKIGPRQNNRRILLNQVADAFRKIKAKRKAVQSGKGIRSNLAKLWIELGSRAIGSEIGKKIINKRIDSIPDIFKFGASKIRNKNVQKALKSEIADMVVEEAQNKIKNKYNSLF